MTSPAPISPAGPAAASCCVPSTGLDPALDAQRIAAIAKALAEPVRVQLLDVLRRHGRALCQCELLALFELPQSTLSHHLGRLATAGLVAIERRHRWAYYSVPDDAARELTAWLT